MMSKDNDRDEKGKCYCCGHWTAAIVPDHAGHWICESCWKEIEDDYWGED